MSDRNLFTESAENDFHMSRRASMGTLARSSLSVPHVFT